MSKLVYKYRGRNFSKDLKSLEENCFYASDIKKLNDPCETLVLKYKFEIQISYIIKIFENHLKSSLENLDKALINLHVHYYNTCYATRIIIFPRSHRPCVGTRHT